MRTGTEVAAVLRSVWRNPQASERVSARDDSDLGRRGGNRARLGEARRPNGSGFTRPNWARELWPGPPRWRTGVHPDASRSVMSLDG
jgi:hypothetical protein